MRTKQYLLNSINVLNALLLALSTIMFIELVYPMLNTDFKICLPEAKKTQQKQTPIAVPAKEPVSLDYLVVTNKNLFHPERRMHSEKNTLNEKETAKPEIIYYGSVITSEKRIAYIEDKKNPHSTPGRGKRQLSLTEGAMIGDYTLKEVNPDKIVLVRGQNKIIVNLLDQKERNPGNATLKSQRSPSRTSLPPPLPATAGRTKSSLPPAIPTRSISVK